MKKRKSIWLTFLIAALSVAMLIGSFTFTASAAPIAAAKVLENVSVDRRVAYGSEFSFGTAGDSVKVTTPSGRVLADTETTGNKVKALEVGTYTVTYTTGADEYSFDVYSYVDEQYSIRVENNGADIPTYIKKDGKIVLPKASLVWYDDKGDEQVVAGVVIKARLSVNNPNEDYIVSDDEADEITNLSSGILNIQYYAQLEGGSKYYTKDFTVNVQQTFEDKNNPSLNVVNVPRNVSTNRKVTLPTATVSDDFDKNVRVIITVNGPDGQPVKKATVNDDGYATGLTDEAVVFDNDKRMFFYPTVEDGTYTVTYKAVDDSGNESAVHNYTITAKDTTAPVFKDIEESAIPDKWGLTVRKAGGTAEAPDKDNHPVTVTPAIRFPVPEVVDNKGLKDGDNWYVTVSFEIKDSKNKSVIKYNNILDETEAFTYDDAKYKKPDGAEGDSVTFRDLAFDFNNVGSQPSSKTGAYTVEYVAKDQKNNRITKSYTIDVSNTYEDFNAPAVAEIKDVPSYFVVDGEEDTFTVPTASVSDAETTRVKTVYTITSDAATNNTVEVKSGDEAEIVEESGTYFFQFDEDKKLQLGTKLTLKVTATDSVGQVKTSADYEIAVISKASLSANLTIASTLATDGDITVNTPVTFDGEIKIDATEADYKYTGFEFYVMNPDGDELGGVQLETYYNKTAEQIVIRNVTLTPGKVGEHKIVVRAYNLSGKSSVTVIPFSVAAGDSSDGGLSAASMPTTGTANTTYKFRYTKYTDNVGNEVADRSVAHRIKGGRMTVMNDEFTALATGTYSIRDLAITADGSIPAELKDEFRTYSISVSGDAKPVIEVLGLVPTYSELYQEVTLPVFAAVTEYGNVTPDVKITKNDELVTRTGDAATGYKFTPTDNGKYTVTVTASYEGTTADPLTFTINAGDVIAPDFKLSTAHATKAKIDSKFSYGKVEITQSDDDEEAADFKYTKKLIDPSGEEVANATISGTGTSFANKSDNGSEIRLTKSGNYTVVYEVTDKNGNTSKQQFVISVTAQASENKVSLTAISTVLIIVGVVLIAGVIVYLVRYRKVKPNAKKTDKK